MASGNLQDGLKESGMGVGSGRRHERLRAVLVVTEVALACTLLVGAGLLLRSFLKVLDVELGFQPARSAAVTVDYEDNPADGDGNSEASANLILAHRAAYLQPLIQRVSALPGVQAAGTTDFLPLAGNRSWGLPFPKGVKRPDEFTCGGSACLCGVARLSARHGNQAARARLHLERQDRHAERGGDQRGVREVPGLLRALAE